MTRAPLTALLTIALGAGIAPAQGAAVYTACRDAAADANAATPGTWMFSLPGVATDFVIDGGGQLVERGDGTAWLSAVVHRASEIDRVFLLTAELGGAVQPGDVGYPPEGALPPGLLPQAYTPIGPVDPSTFRYYTVGSGMLRGYGAYAGALVDLQLATPLQIGTGASDRNVQPGLAANWSVQVLSQPSYLTLLPTDEARLRATTSPQLQQCASHADRDPAFSAGPERFALDLGGVVQDYVFIPVGTWSEAADGTATLTGTLRRENDFDDRWELSLLLQNRTDPGDGNYPPVGAPILGLLSSAYVAAGGIVDPGAFHYYGAATGTLTGAADNAGGSIVLSTALPVQVGIGANQANAHFGVYGEFAFSVSAQPAGAVLPAAGSATLRASIGARCVLPYPNQTPGLQWSLDNVTDQTAMITGANLAWIEQMAIGTNLITTSNTRNWKRGYLVVHSSSLVEIHPPQGLPPANYPTRVFTRVQAGGVRQMSMHLPPAPALHTSPDRFVGESQDWVISHGNLGASTLAILAFSATTQPSVVPGIVSLGVGNQFADLTTLAVMLTEPLTATAVFHAPAIPATLQGGQLYFQAVLLDPVSGGLPVTPTNVTTTVYQ